MSSKKGAAKHDPARSKKLRKRSYNLPEFARDLLELAPHLPAGLASIRGTSALLREEVFLAVAKKNGCRYCTYIHEGFAAYAGASDEEIATLEGAPLHHFDRKRWIAVQYAVASLGGRIDPHLKSEAKKHYSKEDLAQLEALARAMNLSSLCGNTVDSLLWRLSGKPGARRGASAAEELFIALLAAPIGGPALLASAVLKAGGRLRLPGLRREIRPAP
ncbi:MAG: hypothetical protein AB1405_08925 [Bdellovibrionota bacterium]